MMAIKVTENQIGNLRQLDTHPIRNFAAQMTQERQAFMAVIAAAIGELKQAYVDAAAQAGATKPEPADASGPAYGTKRLTIHRDQSGRISSIDITEV